MLLLFAVLTCVVASSLGCACCLLEITGFRKDLAKAFAERTASVVLDDDRFAYARGNWLPPATTRPVILGRGVLHQAHEWVDLKDEIHRLGKLENPNAMLLIQPAREREKNLEMVVDECKKAGVRYNVLPPARHSIDELLRAYRDESKEVWEQSLNSE